MFYNVVVITCLLFASTFASPTAEQNVARAHQRFSHPKDKTSGVGPRVIGGNETAPNKYPYQVALLIYKDGGEYMCGGTLYSNRFVLTAAHCVDVHPDYILVELGAHDISDEKSIDLVINTTKYVYHHNWNENTFQNDIALVELPENVTFTNHIQPVKLAKGNKTYAGENGTTIGWGETETEDWSDVLIEVNSTVLSNEECAAINVNYEVLIKPMHVCMSGDGIVGSCDGDSGGPLLVNGVQVGIVSFGPQDCELGWPSVFTRVTEFQDWIAENIS